MAMFSGEEKGDRITGFIHRLAESLQQGGAGSWSLTGIMSALENAAYTIPKGPSRRALEADIQGYANQLHAILRGSAARPSPACTVESLMKTAEAALSAASKSKDVLNAVDALSAAVETAEASIAGKADNAAEIIAALYRKTGQLLAAAAMQRRLSNESGAGIAAKAAAELVVLRHRLARVANPRGLSLHDSTALDAAAALGDHREALLDALLARTSEEWCAEDAPLFRAALATSWTSPL
eukprot:gene27721-34219_t